MEMVPPFLFRGSSHDGLMSRRNHWYVKAGIVLDGGVMKRHRRQKVSRSTTSLITTGAKEETFRSPMMAGWSSAYSVHVLLNLNDPSAGSGLGFAGTASLLVAKGTKTMGAGRTGDLSALASLEATLLTLLLSTSGDGYCAALTVCGCAGGVEATGAGGMPGTPGNVVPVADAGVAPVLPVLACEAGVEEAGLLRFVGVKGAAPTDSGFTGDDVPLLGDPVLDPGACGGGRPPTIAAVGVRGADAVDDMGLGA